MLLHVCCAPDATIGFERLGPEYEITAYFFNPNIHPREEYDLRKREFERLCQTLGIPYDVAEYNPEAWFEEVRGFENEPERGKRCDICLRIRLERTAQEAARRGFDCFAAVLTVSPHKLAQRINEIGAQMGERYGVRYVPTDLKKKDGFKRSVELSRRYGLYRQDYCGCVYSLRDRDARRRRKTEKGMATEPGR